MTPAAHIREKARQLRGDKRLTIDEIAERLAVSRTTVISDPTFRDLVCMYIGEGYKRSRNKVAIANSARAS